MSQGKTVSSGLCLYKMFTERNDFSHLLLESPFQIFNAVFALGQRKEEKKKGKLHSISRFHFSKFLKLCVSLKVFAWVYTYLDKARILYKWN
jgi:hypothetical protein